MDPFNAGRLLPVSRRDFRHDVGHAFHTLDHIGHSASRLPNQTTACLHAANRIIDQSLDLFGGCGGALRQAAYLGRHDRKATTLLTRTGRFYGSIERQNIRLKSDAINHTNDVRNLLGRSVNIAHGLHHLGHYGTAALGDTRCGRSQLIGLLRTLHVLTHDGSEFLHRRRRILQNLHLLGGALMQLLVAVGNTARRRRDGDSRCPHAPHQVS